MALADKYLELVRPAVAFLESQNCKTPALILGGDPRLPVDMDWPVGPGGKDLEFVAEIALSELPDMDELPLKSGSLLLFNNHWGAPEITDALGICLYLDAGVERTRRPHPKVPFGNETNAFWAPDEAITYSAIACLSGPSASGADGDRLASDVAGQIAIENVESLIDSRPGEFGGPRGYGSPHLLGWAYGCQAPIEDQLALSNPGEGWRSFFTLFDDVGVSSWSIRQNDFVDGDFDNLIYYWDC